MKRESGLTPFIGRENIRLAKEKMCPSDAARRLMTDIRGVYLPQKRTKLNPPVSQNIFLAIRVPE